MVRNNARTHVFFRNHCTKRNPDEAAIFILPYDVGVSAFIDENGLMRRGGGKYSTLAQEYLTADRENDPVRKVCLFYFE
jgi:hypothetical protein